MKKLYAEPEMEIRKYNIAQCVWTSGPTDLHDGEEFDPDGNSGNGAKSYFAG